ncbi:MAG TPA: response regulator [Burkholderiales bacterium]|nr:response regulator [Burkholderiales bacterium]
MAVSILVVDEARNMRELIAIHLRNAGYGVQLAEDGVEAGYAVLRMRPDLIIADLNMPHMDGLEFVAAIRGESSMRDTPVIFLTAAGQGQHRGKELGTVDYVPKPVRADSLLSLVAKRIGSAACSTANPV